jgi:hypothetical protein
VSLEFIDTEELVNEVLSRFDHAGFVGLLDRTDHEYHARYRWRGNGHTIVGLASAMQRIILRDMDDETTWDERDDDDQP